MATRYYKLHRQENQKNEERTISSTGTTTTNSLTSTTGARTRAHAREEDLVREMLKSEYKLCIGGEMTAYIATQLDAWRERVGEDVLLYAIHESAMAPRPSWRYCLAILTRCEAQGITASQAQHDDCLSQAGYRQTYSRPMYEPPLVGKGLY